MRKRCAYGHYAYFNSHTREGVTSRLTQVFTSIVFQLTHPWGCDAFWISREFWISNFNSHTREGVTVNQYPLPEDENISTHTPVRVWRFPSVAKAKKHIISTHTPVRVWPNDIIILQYYSNISTHTPVRVWLVNTDTVNHKRPISTHTPVRVWLLLKELRIMQTNFNSHTREGVTSEVIKISSSRKFQLTHPWGCDWVGN